MKNYTTLFFSMVLVLFSACQSGTTESKTDKAPVAAAIELPKMTNQMMSEFFLQVDAIDVTFYDAPMSMSSNDQNVRSFLAFVSPDGITSKFKTKADGAMFYLSKGDIIGECEFYLNNQGTGGYAMLSYKKQKYFHKISESGARLIMQPLNQFKSQMQQQK